MTCTWMSIHRYVCLNTGFEDVQMLNEIKNVSFVLQVFIGHSEPIRQVRFTPDQMGVVTAGDALFFWDFLAPPQEAVDYK